MDEYDVIIVGTGHGGAHAAIALRQNGFEGSILLIGRERYLPYERPPLSKDYLAGAKPFERAMIRPEKFWADKDISLRLGTNVTEVNSQAHCITLGDGEQIGYHKLIWATGGDARRLSCPGAALEGIHTLRNRPDADRIRAELDADMRKVVVVGGGYIGLEGAAVLRQLGREVTLLESQPRLLARVAGPELSAFFLAEHRRQGVDVRLEVEIESIEGSDGRVTGVKLTDGEMIAADLILVGIGIVPSVGPLVQAGASGGNGVDVDEFCRTVLDDIYAIGDCASHANIWADGAVIRLESVQNANDMATTTAKAICGDKQPYQAFPWFWSNQYDLKLQTAGLSLDHTETVIRGNPAERKFSIIYLKEGRVIAIDCINSTKDFVQGRKLIEAHAMPSVEELADPDKPLKELL